MHVYCCSWHEEMTLGLMMRHGKTMLGVWTGKTTWLRHLCSCVEMIFLGQKVYISNVRNELLNGWHSEFNT